jgi:hypothetical protein
VISIGLFVLAAINIFLMIVIARAFQPSSIMMQPIQSIQPSSTMSSNVLIPSATSVALEPLSPTTQAEILTTPSALPTAVDEEVPDLLSPFSLQIAALHQVSIEPALPETESNSSSANETDLSSVDDNAFDSLATALKNSGVDWVRLRIEWELIQPNKPVPDQIPEYDWKYHDDNLRIVAETGVRIIATLSDSPSWAASAPCASIFPDRLDDYAQFLKDLVNRYNGPPFYIKHWELVNEPDSDRYTTGHFSGHGCWAHDGDQYAQMLAVASQAIKEADPQATILMGGIAHDWFEEYGGPFYRYFPDDVMLNGGGNYFDLLNFHFFTDFRAEWDRWNPQSVDRQSEWIPAPTCGIVDDGEGTAYDVEGIDIIAKVTHFRNRMDACYGVSKPVWVTEVGLHGYPDDQESLENQARYVIMVYARALSAGVQNVTWFSLDPPPYDPYGQALLNPDFSPKPAFFAYQTLTRELDGYYEYSNNQNTCSWSNDGASCSVEAYTFKDGANNEKTVAWGSEILSLQADQLRVVERNGNESTIMDGGEGDEDGLLNGTVELQLSEEPVFISTE